MELKLETDGGFTGRGIGSVAIDGEMLSEAEQRELRSLLENVPWGATLGAVHPDQITYTLTCDGRSVSWRGESEMGKLRDWIWGMRSRM
jgi:hypothetical protein